VAVQCFEQRRVTSRKLVRLIEIFASPFETLLPDHGLPVGTKVWTAAPATARRPFLWRRTRRPDDPWQSCRQTWTRLDGRSSDAIARNVQPPDSITAAGPRSAAALRHWQRKPARSGAESCRHGVACLHSEDVASRRAAVLNNPIDVVELALEKGATTIMMPVACRRALVDLSDDVATKVQVVFYADASGALRKSLHG
jgi:hypothetical protein